MARFPSIKSLTNESLFTLKRFPLCLLSAIIGSAAGIYLMEASYNQANAQKNAGYLMMVCSLGLTLFFSISLYAERKKFTKSKTILINAIALILFIAYYFFLRYRANSMEYVRYALVNIAFHLFASFAAYTDRQNLKGFWQFNKALFLRLFFAVIYSGTLYLGICLALLAIDQLFNAHINGKNYMRLWIVIAGVFNTWFFLAGVPKNLEELDESDDYPKGLKIFTQYVLLPLVTIYLLILYAYTIKIIFIQHLPKGWVSYLVIGFSVLGVLALLLVHPIRNREGNKWIHIFSKWFYGALYPLVILLFVAIGTRIGEYGITENRYFIIVLALWLAGISTYFLFTKVANIKYIPLSLCLIALLCSFGPWGAFSVAEKSQMHVLEKVLTENKILVDGKIDTKHKTVPDTIAEQITSIVRYFDNMHGFNHFKPWFTKDIDSLIADTLRYQRVDNVMKLLNIPVTYNYYRNREDDTEGYKRFNYYTSQEEVKEISGYDYEFNFYAYSYTNYYYEKAINITRNDSLSFDISKDSSAIELKRNHKLIYSLAVADLIKQWNDSVKSNNGYSSTVPYKMMQKTYEDSTLKVKLQFNQLSGTRNKDKCLIENSSGVCFIKIK